MGGKVWDESLATNANPVVITDLIESALMAFADEHGIGDIMSAIWFDDIPMRNDVGLRLVIGNFVFDISVDEVLNEVTDDVDDAVDSEDDTKSDDFFNVDDPC